MPKRKQFFIFTIGFLILGLFAFPEIASANGNIWHVATSGNDESGNGTTELPWKTIQGAINKDAVTNGDTVIVHNGTYTENVDVTKSLTIKSENGYATTTVVAANTNDHVFEVTASNVTIGGEDCGFSIYGATYWGYAGIYLEENVTGCIIQGNRCGWEDTYNNDFGIYSYKSNNNTLTNNICNSNLDYGVYLSYAYNNTITENTVNSNDYIGIYLHYSSSNTLMGNICESNYNQGIRLYFSSNNTLTEITASYNRFGIYLESSSNYNTLIGNATNWSNFEGIYISSSSNNMLTGNNTSNNHYGIYLESSSNYNTLTDNSCNSNIYGIYLSSSNNNTIYLNNLSGNTSGNAYVQSSSDNIWHSPTTIYYDYTSSSFHKNYLGNYYSDYSSSGQDPDGDGIGTSAYSKNGMTDSSPLMATSDHYSLQAWWLSSDSKMYRDDMSKAPGSVTISGTSPNNYKIWIADQATLMDINFSGGDTWTGQIVFTSAPASDHTFTIEIGSSTNGTDFTAGGPDATINGNGTDSVFTYTTNASAFTVTTGKYLALRITNNSSSSYAVQTGGAWSYCSSPLSSTDYSLPVELTSFTATPGNGIITLKWLTESEIENLGFNIYRSTNTNLEFIILNAELIPGAGSSSEKHEYSYVDHDVKSGITYWYKLEDVDYKGKTELHGAISATTLGPKEFCLHPNYPNPFNPVTTISYDLPKDVYVELTVYNMLGEKVTTLVKGNQPAGYYSVEWDGRDSRGRIVSSGMYFLRISAGSYCKTNKMVFVR